MGYAGASGEALPARSGYNMSEKRIHLNGRKRAWLPLAACGCTLYVGDLVEEVTCGRCLKTREYRQEKAAV